jgi:tyrosyl-tRNA synthetase
MFGKVMSISDDLMWRYYELLTDLTPLEIEKMKSSDENPRNLKVNLAKLIVKDFHSLEAANKAEENFVNQFSKGNLPYEIEEKAIKSATYKLIDLLIQTEMVASKGEAKRLIEQGGVKLNGEKATNANSEVALKDEILLQVGKRKFLKVKGI